MNIGQLEYLVEVAEQGSYAKAARRLYVTPQAISKSLGDLEKELNVRLLDKVGRRVCLTEFAKSLAEQAEDALQIINEMRTAADNYSSTSSCSGKVAIAVSTIYHRVILFRESDFSLFRENYPNVSLETLFFSSESCLSAFREEIVDAAIIMGKYDEIGVQNHKLLTCDLHVTMACDHALRYKKEISLEDIKSLKIAMPQDSRCGYKAIRAACESRGIKPEFECIAPFHEAYKKFLGNGGVYFSMKSFRESDLNESVISKPLCKQDRISIPFYLVCRDKENDTPVSLLKSYLRNIIRSSHDVLQ